MDPLLTLPGNLQDLAYSFSLFVHLHKLDVQLLAAHVAVGAEVEACAPAPVQFLELLKKQVTAPEELLNRLRGLSTKELVAVAARFRLGDDRRDVASATKFALRSLARRYEALSGEIAELDSHLDRLVAQVAPELVSLAGIGTSQRSSAA
jgi:phosphate uptake regulator